MHEHDPIAFLPDRLDREPVIFRGLTHTELFFLAQAGALVWFPLALLVCWCLGAAVFGLALGLVMTLATVMLGGSWLQRRKRGRPDGWFSQRIRIWLQDRGWVNYGFRRHSGYWDIRRRRRCP